MSVRMDKFTASFAAEEAGAQLQPFTIERRPVGPRDVQIEIDFCGVCHTDLHFVNNDWGMSTYPLVPGHEIIGKISALGNVVDDFTIGQRIGVGTLVGSCRECDACHANLEQYCTNGFTMTYASPTEDPGGLTFGGYSKRIVVDRDFVLTIPENLDSRGTAPLLCAGITTYSPLAHWKVGPGMTVGVIGLGGLGHMGIKFAHAMGARVVTITTSAHKASDAKRLGADDVLLSTDEHAMKAWTAQFDFLLNTIPVPHDFNPFLELLRRDATMCIVGSVGLTGQLNTAPLILARRRVAGSLTGGLKETQEMLDFSGRHGVVSEVEVIDMMSINDAYTRMQRGDVKYRFVIDLGTLSDQAAK